MADGWKPGERALEVVKLVVQVLTVVIAGAIAFQIDAYKGQVAKADQDEEKRHKLEQEAIAKTQREREIANQTRELEMRRNEQRQKLLVDLAPRILGASSTKDNCRYVLDAWREGMGEAVPRFFDAACAEKVVAEPAAGPWAVLAGYDTNLATACVEVRRATNLGFAPARLLRDWNNPAAYRTVVGAFSTRSDAEQFAIQVRASMRPDSLAVDVSRTFRQQEVVACP